MRRWFILAVLSVAAVACTSSAGRSSSPVEVAVNPVDSLLAVVAGQYDAPELKVKELAGTYGEYRLNEEDRTRLAEGFAAISGVDGTLHEYLLPALQEELHSCETFADVCGRLGLTKE